MSIRFVCPLGHRLKVPDERAGKKGRCPVCNQRLIVPVLSSPGRPAEAASCAAANDGIVVDDGEHPLEIDTPSSVALAPALSQNERENLPIGPDMQAADAPLPSTVPPAGVGPLPVAPPPPPPGSSVGAAIAAPPPLPAQVLVGSAHPTAPSAPPMRAAVAPRTVGWATWAQASAIEAFAVYRANPRQLELAYWTACLLPFAAVFCAAPALPHLQFVGAPCWAQALICMLTLQLAYSAWLATMPDWSTVRIGQFLLAGCAGTNLVAMIAIAVITEPKLSSFGLAGVRWTAVAWCGLSLTITLLASAGCRWLAHRWRCE